MIGCLPVMVNNDEDEDFAVGRGGRRFLTVPEDELCFLTSPPCSPVPDNWGTMREGAPPQVPEAFDLTASYGQIDLGDGRILDLEKIRGSLDSSSSTSDSKPFNSPALVRTTRGIILPKGDSLGPVIIVDCYE